MIKVNNIVPKGIVNGVTSYKIDFEFDNASALPIKVYQVGLSSYILADESSAFNTIDNDTYIYRDGKWNKTPGVKPDKVSNINNITKNGNYSIPNNDTIGINNVNVNVKSSGDNELSDVVFYDYDGTIVKSYGKNQFLELESLPDNPTHEGLTAQGWNWNLEDAKDYVSKYGELNVGQQYITDDGATRLYVNLKENRTTPTLTLFLYANSELDVDWGDGSEHSTLTSDSDAFVSEEHIYSDTGEYVISIKVVSGSFSLKAQPRYLHAISTILGTGNDYSSILSKIYAYTIEKVEIGENVEMGNSSFCECRNLSSISIPTDVIIGEASLTRCETLSYVTVPNSTKTFGTVCDGCCNLITLSLPNGFTSIGGGCFDSCRALNSLILPETCTTLGSSFICNTVALTSLILPDTITAIGNNVFAYATGLRSIKLPVNLKSIGNATFVQCTNLMYVDLPESLESIGADAFARCSSLQSITIPPKVDRLVGGAFGNCTNLISITFLGNTLNVYDTVFEGCPNIEKVIILGDNVVFFGSIFSGCAKLTDIVLSKNDIMSTAVGLFQNCTSLYSVTLPTACQHLIQDVFNGCTALQSLVVPTTVFNIGDNALKNCTSMKSIRFLGTSTIPMATSTSFQNLPTTTIIYAPALVVNKYMNATYFPSKSTYKYVGFATYEDGETLPTKTSDKTHNLTWYATTEDAVAQTNPITVGNGNEVYARATAV